MDDFAVLVAENQQAGQNARIGVDVRDLFVRVGVALAHEPTAQQPDADLLASLGGNLLDGHGVAPCDGFELCSVTRGSVHGLHGLPGLTTAARHPGRLPGARCADLSGGRYPPLLGAGLAGDHPRPPAAPSAQTLRLLFAEEALHVGVGVHPGDQAVEVVGVEAHALVPFALR